MLRCILKSSLNYTTKSISLIKPAYPYQGIFLNQNIRNFSQKAPKGFEKFKRERSSKPTPKKDQTTPETPEEKYVKEKIDDPESALKKKTKRPSLKKVSLHESKPPPSEDQNTNPQDTDPDTESPLQKIFAEYKQNFEDFKKKHKFEEKFQNFKKDFDPKSLDTRSILILAALGAISTYQIYNYFTKGETIITEDEFFQNYLVYNKVDNITYINQAFEGNTIPMAVIETTDKEKFQIKTFNNTNFDEKVKSFLKQRGLVQFPIYFKSIDDPLINIESWLSFGQSILLLFFLIRMMRSRQGGASMGENMGLGGQGGAQNFDIGISKAKVFKGEMVKTKFNDVAGLAEAKLEIVEFVDFLKNPKYYERLGAKIPKGALQSGPPGTGKTLLAKACAGEAGVAFFSVSGSEFVEMFVGVGASRVRDLFQQAKWEKKAIVFIDEIDAIGKKREARRGNDEREATLNQLLVEMDGFGSSNNIVVFAATNRKELLDPAQTRPGRFDRTIDITNPDLEARKEIFEVHLEPLKQSKTKKLEDYARRLATLTPSFSGSDIAAICNEAAILAARENKDEVSQIDFEMAVERIIGGIEVSSKAKSDEERKTVAYHECGHGVVSWFQEGGSPQLKLTIIPRSKGALGFAQYQPNEVSIESKEELEDKICSALGGRLAEEEFFGQVTTGAYDDLQKVYKYAHHMVTKLGFSEKLGYISFEENRYGKKGYSKEYNHIIDEEINKIVNRSVDRARQIIQDKRDVIILLADRLLEKKTLELKEITEILGPRPFEPKSTYKAYLTEMSQEMADSEKEVVNDKTEEQSNEEKSEIDESTVDKPDVIKN